jgi:hypothetical protein
MASFARNTSKRPSGDVLSRQKLPIWPEWPTSAYWVRMIKELASSRVITYTLPCSRVRGKWRAIIEVRAAIYVGISGGAFAGCGWSEIIS